HVPAYPYSPFWRALGQLWSWLRSLPFGLVVFALGLVSVSMPQARYLGFYQNWPLIWMYPIAQSWYRRAGTAFIELGDDVGALRAEQQLAEIQRLFGYPSQAQAQLEQLRT